MPRKKKAEKEGLMHHFCAEFMTQPKMTVRIRFSEVHTDE